MTEEVLFFKKCRQCLFLDLKDNFLKNKNHCKYCISKNRKCVHGKRKQKCEECKPSGICPHNTIRKNCKICRGTICEHGKIKSKCKECGGSQICEHGKRRYICKDCGGKGICEHGKEKKSCNYCGKRCPHNRVLNMCRECKGASICEHNKLRNVCKECNGSSICEHDKIRYNCKDCGGKGICEHNKIKRICVDCMGKGICEHKTQKNKCILCGGKGICEHNTRKDRCKLCKGSSICEHNRDKHQCYICNPNIACRECKSVYADKRSHSYPLCQACFCVKYPDHEKSTLYKIKERYLRDELRDIFNGYAIDMIFDRQVDGGCSSRRPDVLIDCLTHSIIIECDEGQHKNYKCENKRSMQLFEDLGNRPIVMIRFNPDSYLDKNNERIKGCFIPLTDIQDIHKKRFYNIDNKEWKRRIEILKNTISEHLDIVTFPNKEFTELKLFYDGN